MDSIKSALENIQSDNGKMCGSLHYIRSNMMKNHAINELRELGGIKILMKCLKQVNPKVLSLTLSILANCSMNEACRDQLIDYGVVKDLVFIMKNINVESIDNRTCRMIANLAISEANIPVIFKHSLPSLIVKILLNTKCDITRYSGIRAIRKMWENSTKYGSAELLKCDAVRVICSLLTSKNKNIVIAVLRAHISFLVKPTNLSSALTAYTTVKQVLGNEPETTLNNLMDLLPTQPLVKRIIYQLCKIQNNKQRLHSSRLIMCITDVLKTEDNRYLRIALCHLLECPMNRESFSRTENGISVFMDLMTGTDSSLTDLAIYTLIHFKYCKDALEKMVKKGLVSILIKNLSLYIQSHKVSALCQPETNIKSNETKALTVGTIGSDTPILKQTPLKENWTSSKEDDITIDSHSPYYSPVCESYENESFNADESKSDVSDFELQGDEALDYQTSGKSNDKCYIIELLTNLAFIENIVIMMASKDVWESVLDYIQFIKYSNNVNEIKILEKISKDVRNFKIILTDGFIISTHQRLCRPVHELEKCDNCKNRNKLGIQIIKNATSSFESSFAEDIMINIMNDNSTLATNQNLKLLVTVTLPHVIQSQPNKLLAFLSRYKIFDNLCNIIKDGQNELFDDAVGALLALFTTLNITYPKPVSKVCKSKNCGKNIIKHETTVTLVLDDDTLINTNKSFLSLKSPVFEAMFRDGGFKEAYESTVRLNDVSSECFNSFLLLLEEYCDCLLPNNITVLLELIMITDKYMLYDLSKKISMVMINNSIAINNCDIIYEWLIETGHKLNCVSNVGLDVVKCLFSSNSRFPERVEAIKKITTSCYGENFIKDLSTILKIGFSSICNDDKFTKFYLKTFDCNED